MPRLRQNMVRQVPTHVCNLSATDHTQDSGNDAHGHPTTTRLRATVPEHQNTAPLSSMRSYVLHPWLPRHPSGGPSSTRPRTRSSPCPFASVSYRSPSRCPGRAVEPRRGQPRLQRRDGVPAALQQVVPLADLRDVLLLQLRHVLRGRVQQGRQAGAA